MRPTPHRKTFADHPPGNPQPAKPERANLVNAAHPFHTPVAHSFTSPQTAPHPFAPHPLAQLAASLAAGILAANIFSPPLLILLVNCLTAGLLTLAFLWKRQTSAATAFLAIAFLFAGGSLASIETRRNNSDTLKALFYQGTFESRQPVELTGVLQRYPETAPDGFYLTLRVERVRERNFEKAVSGLVTILLPVRDQTSAVDYQRLELRYGARLRVMTALNRSDDYRNPGVSKFTEYLDRKGHDAAGYLKSPLLIERLDDVPVFLPIAWVYQLRQRMEAQIIARFSPETAGVLLASILGNRHFLSHATAERFREGGTFHVLVISGLHISFIGGLMFLLARRITRNRSWQFVLATAVLWSYAIGVGAEASVVRAALMFTLIAFAPIVSRRGASLNSLGAAALVLLIWRPSELFDPSFQLTFLSVLAIVVFGWPLLRRMSRIGSWRPTRETPTPPVGPAWLRSLSESLFWSEADWLKEMARLNYSYKIIKTPLAGTLERYRLQRPLRYAFGATLVSVTVQITMLPLFVIYFHRVSISSIILNIIVSLLMAVLALAAVVGLALEQISTTLASPAFGLANAINWMMVHSVDPLSGLGLASMRLPEYSGWSSVIYVLYFLPFMALGLCLSRWHPLRLSAGEPQTWKVGRLALLAQLSLQVIIIAHPLSAPGPDGQLRVDFMDVGQGDAALVTMPDGTTVLVDGGGKPNFHDRSNGVDGKESFSRDTRSVGEAVVSEYLWWSGRDRIDYVLATHADADHMDGLNDVIRNFEVRGALVARNSPKNPQVAKFHDTARALGVPIILVGAGDVLRFAGATGAVLWPPAQRRPEEPSRNNDSIVLRLQIGSRSILLTGDIEKSAETALISANPNLPVDVVKVAHHGSKTSSTNDFVNATRPILAVISVGQRSMFGHPHSEIVGRWQHSGAKILTTGENGMISVTSDGEDLRVKTFVTRP
jgi:competence protein ComEC